MRLSRYSSHMAFIFGHLFLVFVFTDDTTCDYQSSGHWLINHITLYG